MAGVRQLLLFAIALGLTSGTAHARQKFSGQTLLVAEFGGSWQQWLLKNIAPRFEQRPVPRSNTSPASRCSSWRRWYPTRVLAVSKRFSAKAGPRRGCDASCFFRL